MKKELLIKKFSQFLKEEYGLAEGVNYVLAGIVAAFLGLALVGVYGSVGATILTDLRGTQTANAFDYNVTTDALTGLDNASNRLGLMGTVIGFVAVLGIVGLIGFGAYKSMS